MKWNHDVHAGSGLTAAVTGLHSVLLRSRGADLNTHDTTHQTHHYSTSGTEDKDAASNQNKDFTE